MFHEARNIVRAEGVSGLAGRSIAYAYQRCVRPYIPGRPIKYAGISICQDRKWGDRWVPISWVPNYAEDQPGYEAALVGGLREAVRPGDSIVIVGAGVGVTAVVAAFRAGPSGVIQCFEARKHYVKIAQQTAARNQITNINIQHAVVARLIAAFDSGGATDLGPSLPPSELPTCDVLQMNCEGAEAEILREIIIQPRAILVKTHGMYGAPTNLIASLLEKHGYVVADRGLAAPSLADDCVRNDIRVLLGILRK